MKNKPSLLIALLFALALPAPADQLFLKNGKVLKGHILAETPSRVSLQVANTITTDVPRSRIARIVRAPASNIPKLALPRVNTVSTKQEPTPPNHNKVVCFLQIHGTIESTLMVSAVRRSCARARELDADIVVFEIDTPGGRLDLLLELCSLIEQLAPTQTITYVAGGPSGGAYSAGAVLAMACGTTYIAPGTAIGAAAPVLVSSGRSAINEKYVSAIRAKVRSLAQKNGYPPKVAAAMVDAEIEIREATVNGKPTFLSIAKAPPQPAAEEKPKIELGDWITKRGKLLTLTATEAKRYKIATAVVATRAKLVETLDLVKPSVIDLNTDDALADAHKRRARHLTKLDASIASYNARAVAIDPRLFKYPRHPKAHGIYARLDFLDNGRLWRHRSSACIKTIDACLAACRQKLVLARKYPEMRIADAPVKAIMSRLVTLRERVASEYGLRGSEK